MTARVVFSYRDREDELEGVARRIKADRRRGVKPPLDRIGLVVARPLPYLYLAREMFSGAGIPYEALDTMPLAGNRTRLRSMSCSNARRRVSLDAR